MESHGVKVLTNTRLQAIDGNESVYAVETTAFPGFWVVLSAQSLIILPYAPVWWNWLHARSDMTRKPYWPQLRIRLISCLMPSF